MGNRLQRWRPFPDDERDDRDEITVHDGHGVLDERSPLSRVDDDVSIEALEALARTPFVTLPSDLVEPAVRPATAPAPVRTPLPRPELAPQRRPSPRPRRWIAIATGPLGVAAVALLAGLLAWWFSDRHGLAMAYADARSHLTIARRLLDGPNHSMVQLGTVWLPLPHVVVAPFTLITAWWSSRAAVVPVNLACLIIEALALFRIVSVAGRSRGAAWLAVLLLLTNPGWLYLHTTALGEPVLYAAMLTTVAGLVGWVRSDKPYSGGELALFCGLPAAAAVLSRYDGWAMAAAAGAFVLVVAQLRWRQWSYSLRCLRGFALPSAAVAAWWLWFNFVNWGDPLEFQRGQYSAQAQQQLLADAGLLPDQGNVGRSLHTYLSATADGAGPWLLGAAVLGALLWLAFGRLQPRAIAPWLLVMVPLGFYLMSLYTGQIALRLGDDPGGSMFNLRYGLQVLPGLAALCGLGAAALAGQAQRPVRPSRDLRATPADANTGGATPTPTEPDAVGATSTLTVPGTGTVADAVGRRARWRRSAVALVSIALVVGVAASWWPNWQTVPVVAEGLQQRELGDAAWAGAQYLHDHATEGLIMIDDSVNPMLPVVGADLDRVTAPFSGPRWRLSLHNLRRADWLFVDTAGAGDAVAAAMRADPHFATSFRTVFTQDTVTVYQRRAAS